MYVLKLKKEKNIFIKYTSKKGKCKNGFGCSRRQYD